MKIVDNKVREIVQGPGIEGIYRMIRDCAAVCYQTDVEKMRLSPKEFVEQVLLKNGHGRPLEFGTVYLKCSSKEMLRMDRFMDIWDIIAGNPYTFCDDSVEYDGSYTLYITTNMRVLAQGDYASDEDACAAGYDRNLFGALDFICEPTCHHMIRRTFSMVMSRGCSDDFRTHITLSSLCESTRFCNYSLGKFDGELAFIKPYWFTHDITEDGSIAEDGYDGTVLEEQMFLNSMRREEREYMRSARLGLQPQQLKRLFPLGAKAELILCGDDGAWQNFFWRRCDMHADPECVKVANMVKELYTK